MVNFHKCCKNLMKPCQAVERRHALQARDVVVITRKQPKNPDKAQLLFLPPSLLVSLCFIAYVC